MSVIVKFLDNGSFDEDAIKVLATAFEYACMARPDTDRELLARRIIECAKAGERNPVQLSAAVLSALDRQQ